MVSCTIKRWRFQLYLGAKIGAKTRFFCLFVFFLKKNMVSRLFNISFYILQMYLFVCFKPHEQFFSYLAAVTITGDRAANLGLCSALRAFEQGGIFIVPHLLRHGASVCTVLSERPAPTSHSGIRTPDARIIRSLRPTL
jgi:hypothetical protein